MLTFEFFFCASVGIFAIAFFFPKSSVKLPFLTFPQVREHFKYIDCLFVLRSIWFIYSEKMRAPFSNEANYYSFLSKISHLSYVSM